MDHLDGWRAEAARFCEVLDDADLDARVPACPDWDMADLACHVGWVLDRFTRIAGDRLTERDQIRGLGSIDRPDDDTDLPAWLRDRVAAMDDVLTTLGPDELVWNFTGAPHVGAWVHRRMHHELVVHRHDLEEAAGAVTPIDPVVATDGVDELVTVLSTTGTRWDGEATASLQAGDRSSGRQWQMRLDPGERAVTVDPDDRVDVVLEGESPDLLLVVWRRRPLDTVTVAGDADLGAAILRTIGR